MLPGDANCDEQVGAADLPALLVLLHTGDTGLCGLADASQDGVLSEADICAVIAAIFDPGESSRCSEQNR